MHRLTAGISAFTRINTLCDYIIDNDCLNQKLAKMYFSTSERRETRGKVYLIWQMTCLQQSPCLIAGKIRTSFQRVYVGQYGIANLTWHATGSNKKALSRCHYSLRTVSALHGSNCYNSLVRPLSSAATAPQREGRFPRRVHWYGRSSSK